MFEENDEEIMNLIMIQNINQQRQLHGVVHNSTVRFWTEYIEPLTNRDFKQHFRLGRDTFLMLCRNVGPTYNLKAYAHLINSPLSVKFLLLCGGIY